jgi:NDP-sugar pyrophosphorylase family protein
LSEEHPVRADRDGESAPIWHIMKHHETYSFSDFFVALDNKGELVKRYVLDHNALSGNINVSLQDVKVTPLGVIHEHWDDRSYECSPR